jgi:sulfatase maturation enzyme AslB (radical SAM superfamily)
MTELPKEIKFIVEDNRIYFENVVLESEGKQPWRPAIDAHEEEINFLESVLDIYNHNKKLVVALDGLISNAECWCDEQKTNALCEYCKAKAALEAAGADND